MTAHARTEVGGRTACEREALDRTRREQREHERDAVAAHYEYDPRIFRLVLGRHLAYATGVFHHPDEDLDTAQERKLARVAAKLAIRPGEKVLDVGCGWGSILVHLARHHEADFQGLTLSRLQAEEALRRARESGVAERVRVDVRHVEDLCAEPESIDVAIFSGSIVHMHNRDAIHHLVARLLRPGGRVLISDCFFPEEQRGDRESAATSYIFVKALGYCRLLGLGEEITLLERAGLDVLHVEDLTSSYVHTLRRWIDNVRRHRRAIEELAPGFSHVLQSYMTVARMSFERRTALEYMLLASKGRPRVEVGSWPVAGA